MKHLATSNGGFRAQDISRARFQDTTVHILGDQKQQIDGLDAKMRAQGEFIADMSVRLDDHAKALAEHRAAFQAWGARTFTERLRWLLTGK